MPMGYFVSNYTVQPSVGCHEHGISVTVERPDLIVGQPDAGRTAIRLEQRAAARQAAFEDAVHSCGPDVSAG